MLPRTKTSRGHDSSDSRYILDAATPQDLSFRDTDTHGSRRHSIGILLGVDAPGHLVGSIIMPFAYRLYKHHHHRAPDYVPLRPWRSRHLPSGQATRSKALLHPPAADPAPSNSCPGHPVQMDARGMHEECTREVHPVGTVFLQGWFETRRRSPPRKLYMHERIVRVVILQHQLQGL